MQKRELTTLTRTIQSIYPSYVEDERLILYNYNDVKKNFQLLKGNETPSFEILTKGIYEERDEGVLLKCEYCHQVERVFDTTEWLGKHRRCQQIDFIDRQSKKIKKVGVNKQVYFEMNDKDFTKAYREVMNYYLQHNDSNKFVKSL